MRRPSDPVGAAPSDALAGSAFLLALAREPHAHDLYQALRRIDCLNPGKPRLGAAQRPVDEAVRIAQDPSMSFAPAPVAAFENARPAPRLVQRIFGLLGPNGPLPLHLTEHARERVLHHGDHALARFFDVFNHRLALLFYRAWAQAQPTVSLDRPDDDRFAVWVGALIGIGRPAKRRRDAVGDHAKLHHAGLFARQARSAEGLERLLGSHFGLPVSIVQWVGRWLLLPLAQRTRLGVAESGARLAAGAVAGSRVWDRQHKFRVRIGPLSMADYESLLPERPQIARLVALVRQYLAFELDWDMQLALAAHEAAPARLGVAGRLGWTAWIGKVATGKAGARSGVTGITLDAEARGRSAWLR